MHRVLVSIFCLLLASRFMCFAQEEPAVRYLEVRGISELDMKPLAKSTANLYEGTNKIKSVQTGTDGTFSFRLEINKLYTIEIGKEGLVSKRISFNTTMPDEETGTWMNEFSIGLMKHCDGVDYSALNEPVDRITFDAKRREFISDRNYVAGMRPRLENVLTKYDKCMLDKYEAAVQKGNQLHDQNKYLEAQDAFREALEIYPREVYPSKQIAAINAQLNKQQQVSEQADKQAELSEQRTRETIGEKYNQALAKASVAYTRKDYATAKQFYEEALKIKPEELTPKTRMQEIETILTRKAAEDASRAAETAKREASEKEYRALITKGDELYRAKSYDEAKAAYSRAMTIKPSDAYPSQRVKAIENAAIAEQAALMKSKTDGYTTAMNAANIALAKNEFVLARENFQKALTFKPDDVAAREKLAGIDKKADEYSRQKAALELADKQYKEAVSGGDEFLAQKDLTRARESYAKALVLRPDDKYAQSKVTAIDNTNAAEQVARMKAAEDNYQKAIGAANTALAQKSYTQAKEFLNNALAIKPADPYASGKIVEIDRLVEELHKKQTQEELINSEYKESVAAADKAFDTREFVNAKNLYLKALQLKPGDSYASKQITAIDNTVAKENSTKQRQIENDYASLMAQGSTAIVNGQYNQAKEAFQKALIIKPFDVSAKNKLSEAELLIRQEQDKITAEQARKKNYGDAIVLADNYMELKDYTGAKAAYEKALVLVPGDQYPRKKLDEINLALTDLQRIQTEKQAKENAYSLALSSADKYFRARDYQKARDEYARAVSLKPEEVFPKNKVTEIDKLILKNKQEQADAKAKADAYTENMNSGNAYFAGKDYQQARISYSEALRQMPGDPLAKDQITKIDYLLSELNKQKQAELARKASYNNLIASADMAYDGGNYSVAMDNYKKALSFEPNSVYAKQRIVRIGEINKALQSSGKTNSSVNTTPATRVAAAIPMGELVFKNESERQIYLEELTRKYPAGITLEKYKEKYKETFRYIIVRDNQAQEFRQIKFITYNGAEYSVNGKPITQQYFLSQVKTRTGESFQEIDM
jgi:tetratricopeptide (TPR) repeat protein